MTSRILVGLDDSVAGLAAARCATRLAAGLGAEVHFVHAVTDGDVVQALGALHRDHGLAERRRRDAESLVAHALALAAAAGVRAAGATVQGEPAGQLLRAAREWRADLVVLGHPRRTRVGGLPVGAVTRQLLEFAECPVVVVPQPDPRRP